MNKILIIRLVHMFITGPFLIYLGYMGNNLANWAYWVCLVLGLIVFFVHGRNFMKYGATFIILLHVLLVAPLLVAIGLWRRGTPPALYKIAIIIGSGAIGYHLVRLIKN